MIIPYSLLSPAVLQGVIEDFVLREGTDYGEHPAGAQTLESKVSQVRRQLEQGDVVVVFDQASESCDIVSKGSARYKAALIVETTQQEQE